MALDCAVIQGGRLTVGAPVALLRGADSAPGDDFSPQ